MTQNQQIGAGSEQAIAEGLLDSIPIEEKRDIPFFKQFYECKFPEDDEIDEKD